jgi:predicted nucleic acid-binding protein
MSGGRAFFDTNILLYLLGGDFPAKSAAAQDLFREHTASKTIVLSTQVIQEFYVTASRKLKMPRRELRDAVAAFLVLPLIVADGDVIQSAMRIEERYQISFWDALIVAAAEKGGADVLYTEDLNDGQRYGTVVAKNPFRSESGVSVG